MGQDLTPDRSPERDPRAHEQAQERVQNRARDLPVTAYALLGLLSFGDSLTGYELKQRADRTLRFYWVSPAMSQVYSELERLHALGLVGRKGDGRTSSYALTQKGRTALMHWMRDTPPGFPVLKHPVALRLLLGALVDPESLTGMLRDHLVALAEQRADLEQVRISLQGVDEVGKMFRYPALVADWGLSYLDHERVVIEDLLTRVAEDR